jgi:ferric iron reductase protein FhuF
VNGREVVAAIERAGAGNPLLGIGIGPADGDEPADRLCGGTDAGRDAAGRLVDEVGTWLGTGERRVAASLVVLGYSARLLGPTLAVLLRDGILLDARPARVRWSYRPERGFRLSLPEPSGRYGPPDALLDAWCHEIVDDHLGGVIRAVRAAVPVATGLLWGNVASGLAATLRVLAEHGAVPVRRCHDIGPALLGYGPLRASGRLTLDAGRLTFMRRSCCLFYRIEGAGTCGDCPLG